MICIYEKNEDNFTYNGLGTLEPTECSFSPYINSPWSLKMTLPYDPEGKSNLIKNERIIKVTDIDCIEEQTSEYQLFRISEFRKEQGYVYLTALPIGLDARFDTYVESLKIYNKNETGALSDINNISNKYTVSGSGYSGVYKSAEYENANLISILNGEDGFVTTWDGEVCYDNYNLKVNHRLGTNATPIDVRYGKNIAGMSYDLDATNVITRLYPKAKSGETLNGVEDYAIGILPKPYVDADNASDYPIPHIYFCETPYNLTQLTNDGSLAYAYSSELYRKIRTITSGWLNSALLNDYSTQDNLLSKIDLGWIVENYALKVETDGVEGIVQHMWRKIINNTTHNIVSPAVQNLIYDAMKAGFDDVLKNTTHVDYIGSTTKKIIDNGSHTFYSYEWDNDGTYRVNRYGSASYVWVYYNSKWNQLDDDGYITGATDKTKWKWYKVKGKSFKRYGNKKKNRYLHAQRWQINDIWYDFKSDGQGRKGNEIAAIYYQLFDEASIIFDVEVQTPVPLYTELIPLCTASEMTLFGALYELMTSYCNDLFDVDKLSHPTIKLEINMVDLSRTEEYKDFENLERIHLGNQVRVYNPKLMPEPSTVRVIGLTYDVLRRCNTEITIGITESSIINLLNSIGQSKETKYVAGDGITIENNVIKVNPPETPYMTDFLYKGVSIVRNHVGHLDDSDFDLDGIDVLYGEEAPDDETDGEDKDFYLKFGGGAGNVLSSDDYGVIEDEDHPIEIQNFTHSEDNIFGFQITGIPGSHEGEGETLWFNPHNMIDGYEYKISFDLQFANDTIFYYGANNEIYIGGEPIILTADTNKNHYEKTYTYRDNTSFYFGFHKLKDNVRFLVTITDLTIEGIFDGEIKEIYNKHEGRWFKYIPPTMVGATAEADGESGFVPQPKIADKDKFLKGDGTWAEAGGGTEVTITPTLQSGTKIADYEIDGVAGELYAPKGITTGLAWRSLSETHYEQLTTTEKNNGTIYFVSDTIAELEGKTYIYISATDYESLTTAEKNNGIPYFVYND